MTEPSQPETAPPRRRSAPSAETTVSATLSTGTVLGRVRAGVARYLGVPYAAAPVGEHRFRAPAPAPAWDRPRDAAQPGPTAPQTPYPGALGELLPSRDIPGDGVLHASIWAPVRPAPGGAPVVLWVHGGALTRGSNALAAYDGTAFARDGVLLVAVNYRLGAEGFSVLEDAPRNLGLLDQRFALDWVRREIAAFGGDPDRITLMGESAGGNTVAALLGMPGVAGLVTGAIIQSGPLSAQPAERAGLVTRRMAKHLGVPATRAAFAAIPAAELLAAQTAVTAGTTPITGGPAFALALDEDSVPEQPAARLPAAAAALPILIGTTAEEYRLWFVPTGLIDRITRLHVAVARRRVGVTGAAVRAYRVNRAGGSWGELLGAIATDVLLRAPALALAEARAAAGAAPTFVYEFAWGSPVRDLGAAHSLELGFVFDTLDSPDAAAIAGPGRPQPLADAMHAAWVRFATAGAPGWPRWDGEQLVRVFDGAENPVRPLPRADEWRALLPEAGATRPRGAAPGPGAPGSAAPPPR